LGNMSEVMCEPFEKCVEGNKNPQQNSSQKRNYWSDRGTVKKFFKDFPSPAIQKTKKDVHYMIQQILL